MHDSLKRNKPIAGKIAIIILLSAGLWQFSAANWIHLKAIIAQQLLDYSWQQALNNTTIHTVTNRYADEKLYKPWPWADTWPVAKLIAPEHNVEHIVLAGDDGSSLAFGPGHSFSSAAPNSAGTSIISGHRDTHFSFLQDININETLYLQTHEKTVSYQVRALYIVDSRTFRMPAEIDTSAMILVTCYPFDAVIPGGSLRYLVYAEKSSVTHPDDHRIKQT